MPQTYRILIGALATALIATTARAVEFTYIGPNEYTSAADSPFDTAPFGFCLEDFEDGTYDVPGSTGNGGVVGPGGLIDSVDGDDGAIDGSGTNGHSYFTGDGTGGITITFTEGRTNGFPTEVGIVWTDGGIGAPVTFEAFGPTGDTFGAYGPFQHADDSNYGETAEDRFYGITNATGISKITISNPGGGIEVDHIQLDRCVVCGDTNTDMHVTAADALVTLKTAVGSDSCLPCTCDTNGNSQTSVSDALTILQKSVGLSPSMNCPACDFGPALMTVQD
jgi:hypothetical protein